MKNLLYITSILLLFTLSCKKKKIAETRLQFGTYEGTICFKEGIGLPNLAGEFTYNGNYEYKTGKLRSLNNDTLVFPLFWSEDYTEVSGYLIIDKTPKYYYSFSFKGIINGEKYIFGLFKNSPFSFGQVGSITLQFKHH